MHSEIAGGAIVTPAQELQERAEACRIMAELEREKLQVAMDNVILHPHWSADWDTWNGRAMDARNGIAYFEEACRAFRQAAREVQS